MGLPLFIAPVESDITNKYPAKSSSSPTHARSPIRRSDRRRQTETREHRLRLLAALQGNDSNLSLPQGQSYELDSSPDPSHNGPFTSTNSTDAAAESVTDRLLSDIVVIDATSRTSSRRTRPYPRMPRRPYADAEVSFARWDARDDIWSEASDPPGYRALPRARSPRDQSRGESRPLPAVVQRGEDFTTTSRPERYAYHAARLRRREVLSGRHNPTSLRDMSFRDNLSGPGALHRRGERFGRSVRYADGLGDRDRSLSPEGDGVWDTLQSTLTPDPQPPSVGSSFASTTASAAASQPASSSNTSVSNLQEEVEPPCDPVEGQSGSELDDPERFLGSYVRRSEPTRATSRLASRSEQTQGPERRDPGDELFGSRRTYAAVAADAISSREEESERSERLTEMQRIVRILASRQDIPQEWWASVGLSRLDWDDVAE